MKINPPNTLSFASKKESDLAEVIKLERLAKIDGIILKANAIQAFALIIFLSLNPPVHPISESTFGLVMAESVVFPIVAMIGLLRETHNAYEAKKLRIKLSCPLIN